MFFDYVFGGNDLQIFVSLLLPVALYKDCSSHIRQSL